MLQYILTLEELVCSYLDKGACPETLIFNKSFKVFILYIYTQKRQRIQNTASRLVVRAKKSVHITPILFNLHWLPVQQRIIFKLLLVTFKPLNGFALAYNADLFHQYTPARISTLK